MLLPEGGGEAGRGRREGVKETKEGGGGGGGGRYDDDETYLYNQIDLCLSMLTVKFL